MAGSMDELAASLWGASGSSSTAVAPAKQRASGQVAVGQKMIAMMCSGHTIPHPDKVRDFGAGVSGPRGGGGQEGFEGQLITGRSPSSPASSFPWAFPPHDADTTRRSRCRRVLLMLLPTADGQVEKGGEDAFFVSPAEEGGGWLGALGVADGVGAWSESSVDPGEYSKTLMQLAADVAGPPVELSPQEVRGSAPDFGRKIPSWPLSCQRGGGFVALTRESDQSLGACEMAPL